MTANEQTNAFARDIERIIDRYAHEFDLSYAAAIGVLFIAANRLSDEAREAEMEE